MKHIIRIPLASGAALFAAACAAPSPTVAESVGAELIPMDEPASVGEAAGSQEGTGEPVEASITVQDSAAPSGAGREPSDLWFGFWDEEFKQRFVESYLAASTEVEPDFTFEEREDLERISERVSKEQFDRAFSILDSAQVPGSTALFDFVRGNIHLQLEDLESAIASYRKATERFPRFLRAWKNLGFIYSQRGDHEQAVEAFIRVIELGDVDGVMYGALGMAYLGIDNNLSAEIAFRQAVLLDPGTERWRLGLVRALFFQERYPEAVALTDELIASDPSNADYWAWQANAYVGLEQPMRAAENLELVDQLGGATGDVLQLLGNIYVNEGLYDLGTSTFDRAFQDEAPPSPDGALLAASKMTRENALEEATALLDSIDRHFAGIQTLETRKGVLELRSRVAAFSGSTEEEARVLQELVDLDPLDGQAQVLLGEYWRRVGEAERAELLFDRAIALTEYEREASISKAQLLVELSRYAEAVPLLKRAQAIESTQALTNYLEQIERLARGAR